MGPIITESAGMAGQSRAVKTQAKAHLVRGARQTAPHSIKSNLAPPSVLLARRAAHADCGGAHTCIPSTHGKKNPTHTSVSIERGESIVTSEAPPRPPPPPPPRTLPVPNESNRASTSTGPLGGSRPPPL
jgi:hypothetical protein